MVLMNPNQTIWVSVRSSLIQLCLNWSCSPRLVMSPPFACGVTSIGGATPTQAKWIKLDLGIRDRVRDRDFLAKFA